MTSYAASALLLGLATVSAATQTPDAARADGPEQLQASLAESARRLDASQFAPARESLAEAMCWAAELSDDASMARAWAGLARSQWAEGENSRALESDERALAIRERLGDPEPLALALNNVGLDLYSTGHHAEALDYYFRALEQAVTPATHALVRMNIGLAFRYQGRFEEAESALQEALAIRRAGHDARQTALALNALGLLARITGRYADALRDHTEALALRREEKDRFGEAQSLNNLATVYGDLWEIEKSLELNREALRIALEIGYTRQIGLSHENIGAELDDLGRPKEALAEARQSIALYRKTNDLSNLGNSLSNAGGYLIELGSLEEARSTLSEALEVGRSIGEPELEIVSRQGLGEADLAEAKPADALARLDPALEAARTSGFPALEWKVRYDRARALEALGRQEESIAELRAAIETINSLRTQIGTDAGKIGFLDSCQDVFDLLAAELFAAGRSSEALETSEAGRARALADLLSQRQMLGKPADRTALAEVRGAQTRTRRASPGSDVRGGDVRMAVARLRDKNPELASLVSVDSPKLGEIQRTASRLGATLVEFLSTRDACYTWVVTPAGEVKALRRAIGRDKLVEMIRAVRGGLESADLQHPVSRRLLLQLRELDTLLIAPVEAWLPSSPRKLIVILPHGPLALLPFSALIGGNGRALLSRHTLVFAPAISCLRYTADKEKGTAALRSRPRVGRRGPRPAGGLRIVRASRGTPGGAEGRAPPWPRNAHAHGQGRDRGRREESRAGKGCAPFRDTRPDQRGSPARVLPLSRRGRGRRRVPAGR